MKYSLGLKPHTADERDIKLTEVYSASTTPSSFGATGLDWGMLGNDRYGDCYWASAAHEVMAQATQAGRDPKFSAEHVLDTYAVYLGLYGHQALNESNDEGTDAREGAKYRARGGIQDAKGWGHKIGAYTFIEEPDYDLIKSAVHDFEGVCVCVELPYSAEEKFESGVWDYVKGSEIAGGHAIAGVAVEDDELIIVSWGEEVRVTEAFIEKYLQTVVVYVSGSVLDKNGESINGLKKADLKSKLAELRSA